MKVTVMQVWMKADVEDEEDFWKFKSNIGSAVHCG